MWTEIQVADDAVNGHEDSKGVDEGDGPISQQTVIHPDDAIEESCQKRKDGQVSCGFCFEKESCLQSACISSYQIHSDVPIEDVIDDSQDDG